MTTDRFRGVFAIPPTPFDDAGNLDETSLRRCVDFCVAAGAHGIVTPVNASEAIALTDAERLRVAEIAVEQATGRVPVINGGTRVGPAAAAGDPPPPPPPGPPPLLAMPPYVRHPPAGEIFDFYAAVARAADPLPVWVQDYVGPVGTPMATALLAKLLAEIPCVDYIKEETAHAPQVITAVRELAGDDLKGVMGGMAGRYMLEEYRRGACGTMPACEVTHAHGKSWDAHQAGDADEARRLHTMLLPLLNYEAMFSFTIYKEVLLRRGVIASAKTRVPGAGHLDAENHRELDILLKEIEPLLTATIP